MLFAIGGKCENKYSEKIRFSVDALASADSEPGRSSVVGFGRVYAHW